MPTLHALRRTYTLSFSELAMLTSVPARRLAEFEYHGHPLSPDERRSLATLFGLADHALEGGFVARQVAQPPLTQAQAQALAALAAVAALAWSLRVGQPAPTAGGTRPVLAALGPGAQLPLQRLALGEAPTETPLPSPEPTASATPTTAPTLAPTVSDTPTAAPSPTPTATAAPTTAPTFAPTATAAPTASVTPTEIASIISSPTPAETFTAAAPTATPRPVRGFRIRLRPTPAPKLAQSRSKVQRKAQQQVVPLTLSNESEPSRCPVAPARGRVVITQGYGVGTHAPAEQWGGVDLALGGGPTHGATVVATHSGYVSVALDTWPGGNFVSVAGDTGWRTGYAHLDTVLVASGQYVQAGTPIGTVGSSGSATGPHLHYETWYGDVNQDPSPQLFCR